ncbi:RES family NAD+ phosphorylase [Sphingomonas sp. NPDC092331]|uniref:RES family NAD+ phosphorylase n=1 Tax=Alphaproteobacteria TaxID=28211 RepID=UPI001FDF1873
MATIATGRVLHRVHAATVAAKWYGRKDATWRWDDPDGKFGVLYLGKTLVGPFAETLLRRPTDRDVLWDQVARRRAARFSATRPIRLAKVHGPGLGWFRTTTAGVSADFDPVDNPGAYAVPQRISAEIYSTTSLDGIQYRSRFDSDELCIALFDRADAAISLDTEGVVIAKDWTRTVLGDRGYTLIEL